MYIDSIISFKFTTTLFAIHREHRGSPGNMLQIMMDWRVQLSTGVPTVWPTTSSTHPEPRSAGIPQVSAGEGFHQLVFWDIKNAGHVMRYDRGITWNNTVSSRIRCLTFGFRDFRGFLTTNRHLCIETKATFFKAVGCSNHDVQIVQWCSVWFPALDSKNQRMLVFVVYPSVCWRFGDSPHTCLEALWI